jgi:hypothetical protein
MLHGITSVGPRRLRQASSRFTATAAVAATATAAERAARQSGNLGSSRRPSCWLNVSVRPYVRMFVCDENRKSVVRISGLPTDRGTRVSATGSRPLSSAHEQTVGEWSCLVLARQRFTTVSRRCLQTLTQRPLPGLPTRCRIYQWLQDRNCEITLEKNYPLPTTERAINYWLPCIGHLETSCVFMMRNVLPIATLQREDFASESSGD